MTNVSALASKTFKSVKLCFYSVAFRTDKFYA